MERLEQIKVVANNLKTGSAKAVKALHKLIFEEEGDRGNRKRLREFSGFTFAGGSEEFRMKLAYADTHLGWGDLVAICNMLAIDYAGTKKELTQRICSCLMDLNSLSNANKEAEDEEDDEENAGNSNGGEDDASVNDDENNDENEDEDGNEGGTISENEDEGRSGKSKKAAVRNKFAMTFRDVEDSIRLYSGDEKYPVTRWIADFEETAELFGWTDIQTMIFAKKSLRGLAKLFIQGERGLTSWKKLKQALQDEFSDKINSAELHKLLDKRKIKKDESIQAYFLAMKELAARGEIEDEALFQYVIDGIDEQSTNKSILYGAKNMKEFKEKLKTYEKIRTRTNKSSNANTNKKIRPTKEETRCFNCGEMGHRSIACENRSKGAKCFRCNEFGHKSTDCTKGKTKGVARDGKKAEEEIKKTETVNSLNAPRGMYKIIKIKGKTLNALVDTGSQFNIINQRSYDKIDSPMLTNATLQFSGFGGSKVRPIGCFEDIVSIDDEHFRTTIYVVPDEIMTMEAVIGNELLSQADVNISQDNITISKTVAMNCIISPSYAIVMDAPTVRHDMRLEKRKEVEGLLNEYKPKKIKEANVEMTIIMKEDQKIFARPRRLPFPERKIVSDQMEQWIKEGVIEPCSSDYASPIVVTKKKDGTPRICIDYRAINRAIIKDRYPLPLIEDILDRLQAARIFSSLDLKNGFFHVPVNKDSQKYTAFVTHDGQYQFRKVPFGLCNSPAVFQRYINEIFNDLTRKGIALPYIDDLIIPAENEEEAIHRLKIVLKRAEEYGLEINKRKCQLLEQRIEFLGHVIENGKLYPSPEKTKAVLKFPEPRTIKQVQSFLGLTGYFRKFIPNYSRIANPLSNLLKKNQIFQFGEKENDAFKKLKKCLIEKPVLNIYNQEYETEIHTDASQDGYGAILLQRSPEDDKLHPVYFMSKKTTDAEKKYSSYELEAKAVVEALKKFRVYLLGKTFKIFTDCAAFQQTMQKKDLTTRIARWALILEEYHYTIEHRPGSKLKHVDALSRYPVTMIEAAHDITPKIRRAQESDETIKNIKQRLEKGPYQDYILRNQIVYKQSQGRELIMVPSSMQHEIIRRTHEKGHFAIKRTEEEVKREFFIPNLHTKIEKCIINCIKCILINKKSGKQEGYLHPLAKGDTPLYTYHMDHLGPLESTHKNYKHILVIIDAFTKFTWLYPTKTTTSKEVIKMLEIQKGIFGNPSRIITDRGTSFTSDEFKNYCNQEGIEHAKITAGLPRANGQVERINRTIIPVLAKISIDDPTKWYKHVSRLQQILNSTYQRSIDTTPFELLVGTKMKTNEDVIMKEAIEQEMSHHYDKTRKQLREDARKQIEKVQFENKTQYNLRRRDPSKYHVNDLVAIKRTQAGPGLKLKSKYLGPYRITKVKPCNTYNVEKAGYGEGPVRTTTCAEYLKHWSEPDPANISSSGTDDESGGPNCGEDIDGGSAN